MITEYYRPDSLPEALELLRQPNTLPLGGGTFLSQRNAASVKVVDLQSLGLNTIQKKGNNLEIGAMATLQELLESSHVSETLKATIKLEAPLNIRNSASIAGTLVTADGRSTFTTAMLALDSKCSMQPNDEEVEIGKLLLLRNDLLKGKLITSITIPLNAKLAFESVARTPVDKPIVCAALASWSSRRTRLALGGYGAAPLLAMDGTESDGLEIAAKNALHEATNDWASAEYRMDVAATLVKRCLEQIK